jgi:integrase
MTANCSAGPFSSSLASQLDRFLALKRAVGCRYEGEASLLRALDRFLTTHLPPADPVITLELVRAWVARRGSESETTRGHRLSLIRELCRFLARDEPRTAVPDRHFLRIVRERFVARVLTRQEGRAFLAACAELPVFRSSPLRGVVLGSLLRLLYMTGLRLGEARRLSNEDVDLAQGLLRVRQSKFGKSRLVPIAPDVCSHLRACRTTIEHRRGRRPLDAPFFPTPRGTLYSVYSSSAVEIAFRQVLGIAAITERCAGQRLRVHDLRHSFAVLRLLLWCEQGGDVNAKLSLLATYLGHVGIASTQRYLQLTADLRGEVSRRHASRFGHLISERAEP